MPFCVLGSPAAVLLSFVFVRLAFFFFSLFIKFVYFEYISVILLQYMFGDGLVTKGVVGFVNF